MMNLGHVIKYVYTKAMEAPGYLKPSLPDHPNFNMYIMYINNLTHDQALARIDTNVLKTSRKQRLLSIHPDKFGDADATTISKASTATRMCNEARAPPGLILFFL